MQTDCVTFPISQLAIYLFPYKQFKIAANALKLSRICNITPCSTKRLKYGYPILDQESQNYHPIERHNYRYPYRYNEGVHPPPHKKSSAHVGLLSS